jgi:hypothetical protein
MPTQVVRQGPFLALAAAVLIVGLAVILLGLRPAGAQTVGVQVSSFPGNYTDLPAYRTSSISLTTFCPPDGYPISGGWYIGGPGAADVRVTASYANQRGPGGSWYLGVVKPAGVRAAFVIPYAGCAFGVTEHAE